MGGAYKYCRQNSEESPLIVIITILKSRTCATLDLRLPRCIRTQNYSIASCHNGIIN